MEEFSRVPKNLCIIIFGENSVIFLTIEFMCSNSYTRKGVYFMKVVNSLKTIKARHKNCRMIRRKGRVYVINKTNPRFKARQG